VTNATMYLQNSQYQLTNGVSKGPGIPRLAGFRQFQSVRRHGPMISDLRFGRGPYYGAGGNYALYGGELSLPNGLWLIGDGNSSSSYFQAGGTNRTPKLKSRKVFSK